jgi:hypothetical protein
VGGGGHHLTSTNEEDKNKNTNQIEAVSKEFNMLTLESMEIIIKRDRAGIHDHKEKPGVLESQAFS